MAQPRTARRLAEALEVEIRELLDEPVPLVEVPSSQKAVAPPESGQNEAAEDEGEASPKGPAPHSPAPETQGEAGEERRSPEREALRTYAFQRAAHWESLAADDD